MTAVLSAHGSFPRDDGRLRRIALDKAYAVASGVDRDQAKARAAVQAQLHTLAPEAEAAVLRAGGFRDVELFFTVFTWRGRIGRA